MNMITGIDRPTAGAVTVDGQQILNALSEEQLAIWRGSNVGIVFQFFQLLPTLTALENAMLPLDFARTRLQARAASRPRSTTWSWSGSATSSTTCPRSSRAGSSSGWRSRARSPPIRS